ncbi:MAG: aminopeptidase [Bacteroidetes bacterium]|nr:aminopeptidase [Bacteroidota bacterium]
MLLLIFCLSEYKLTIYGIQQGKGQLSLVLGARPIDEVLIDPNFPDSLKQKLKLISEIKQYTIDSLGMNPSNNYSTVFDQQNQALLYTVSACEPFNFHPKEWTFPFLGTVPYKGFFDKKEAQKEISKLKESGYDIDVYSPSGWSTLGWFKDPILTNMLKQNEGSLSDLIIHELTHGTLFVKDNVNFNENLANFIGDKGAEKFLLHKFGKGSKQYTDYEQSKYDQKIYNEYILKSISQLDSLYNLLGKGNSEEKTEREKKSLIKEIVIGVYKLPLHKKKNYFNYTMQAFWEGNAFFMGFTRYDSQYEIFNKEFTDHYHSDLKMYLQALKEKYPSL